MGTGKTVSVSGISISGTDAGNYTFNTTASTTANITARSLHVTASGVNKVYDGTTAASVSFHDDRVAGDFLTVSYTATFADKNVGTGKTVSVIGISISGSDASNYSLANTTTTTTANITARPLTVSATGENKVYDGTTTATVTLSDNRIAGDVFTDSYTAATFADKNVGTGKTVSVSGISISGTDAGNYTFNTTATTTADITQRSLTVTASGVNKDVRRQHDGDGDTGRQPASRATCSPTATRVRPSRTRTSGHCKTSDRERDLDLRSATPATTRSTPRRRRRRTSRSDR